MKFKVNKPIVYDGVLQRGKVYDSKDLKLADKHVQSWARKRIITILDDDKETQEVEPTEDKSTAPQETKENDQQENGDNQEDSQQENKFTKSELEKKRVDDLKDIAKQHDIEITSDMLKADIVKAILEG